MKEPEFWKWFMPQPPKVSPEVNRFLPKCDTPKMQALKKEAWERCMEWVNYMEKLQPPIIMKTEPKETDHKDTVEQIARTLEYISTRIKDVERELSWFRGGPWDTGMVGNEQTLELEFPIWGPDSGQWGKVTFKEIVKDWIEDLADDNRKKKARKWIKQFKWAIKELESNVLGK